ncbi:MAG: hypothetical protein DRG34_06350 [Deltaproteobacteria bacterium]|nr:MAG: hypothetical protein DRG34_06350 [Deltaproteobacteria bacterium]
MLVVSQPPPLAFLVFLLSDWWEAAKQRAPESPLFTHLSLARASMKIWCIFKSDTAIKWRELLVVEEPFPWPVSRVTFLGKLLVI